jgi:hypothetical protein
MNGDVEAGGALVTAGLTAKALDSSPAPARENHETQCANCHTALIGNYCHACGQAAHVHRSIRHMLEEGLHGVLHFDSKTWRTLPLLIVRPGLLTRRYIDGQRVRYVAPLPLFLFTVFLMFFVVSSVSQSTANVAADESERERARAGLVASLDAARAHVAELHAKSAAAADPDERARVQIELEAAQAAERSAAAALSLFDKLGNAAKDAGERPRLTAEELQELTGMNAGSYASRTVQLAQRLAENPEFVAYKIKNTAYKFAFMLIPISVVFLWLMFFWRRDVRIYDHMVFAMYSLSFSSLLFTVMALLSLTKLTDRFIEYLLLALPLHMFMQLRETYGLGFFSTAWRTVALLVSASAGFVLFMMIVVFISFS